MYPAETLDDRYIGSKLVCLQNWITCDHLNLNVKKSELMEFCEPLIDIKVQNER